MQEDDLDQEKILRKAERDILYAWGNEVRSGKDTHSWLHSDERQLLKKKTRGSIGQEGLTPGVGEK